MGTDLVIGTAQLGSGLSLADLLARQVDPALPSREIVAEVDWAKVAAELQPYVEAARTPAERRRRFGEFALGARTVHESERRAEIESRLPSPDWPVTATRLVAVDNADLAAGAAQITVISPLGLNSPVPTPTPLADILTALKDSGAAVTLISPDEASKTAIGLNSLDPATRGPAATAGRVQGRAGLPPAF